MHATRGSNSVSAAHYSSVIKPDVKQKVGKMLRVENNAADSDAPSKKTMFRRTIKTVLFFTVDVVMLVICVVAELLKFNEWKSCHYSFNMWIMFLIAFCFLCLIVDTIDFLLIQ